MNRILMFLVLICLLSSCAVQHKSLSGLREWTYPQSQFDHQVNFGFVDHVNFQLASQKLMSGKPVYGLIGIRSKQDLTDMKVIVNEIDYQVVQ
ncbi:MAG: hypothetical protein AB7U05_16310 [Mangrovibacterium sp.]